MHNNVFLQISDMQIVFNSFGQLLMSTLIYAHILLPQFHWAHLLPGKCKSVLFCARCGFISNWKHFRSGALCLPDIVEIFLRFVVLSTRVEYYYAVKSLHNLTVLNVQFWKLSGCTMSVHCLTSCLARSALRRLTWSWSTSIRNRLGVYSLLSRSASGMLLWHARAQRWKL